MMRRHVTGSPNCLCSVMGTDVWHWDGSDDIDIDTSASSEEGVARMTREEAIAAAKAILRHYGETLDA